MILTAKRILQPYKKKVQRGIYFLRRKLKRHFRKSDQWAERYVFSVICVNRKDYVELAIQNINSLHFINPNHKYRFFCDAICLQEIFRLKTQLDYPEQVEIIQLWNQLDFPWQFCKIEVLKKYQGKENIIFVDADALWRSDPQLGKDVVTMFLEEGKFFEREGETALVVEYFQKPEWKNFCYFNVTFVSLPVAFQTDQFIQDWEQFSLEIRQLKALKGCDQVQLKQTRRLCEQTGASLALQSNFPSELIRTLETSGSFQNEKILHTFYYGCQQGVD